MGAQPQTIGGGSARGVSDEFSKFLQQALGSGFSAPQYGQTTAGDAMGRSDPMRSTMNISDAIASLLAGGDNMANGAMSIANTEKTNSINDMRSRYSLGGTGYGTPASSAEASYRAQVDPQIAAQVGGMRMDSIGKALSFIFPALQQAYGLGTPQAQTVMKPSGFSNVMSGVTGVAQAAAPFFMPGFGAAAGAAGGATIAPNFKLNGNWFDYNPNRNMTG